PVQVQHGRGRHLGAYLPAVAAELVRTDLLAGHDLAEPEPLHVQGQVLDQPVASTARRIASSGRFSRMPSTCSRCAVKQFMRSVTWLLTVGCVMASTFLWFALIAVIASTSPESGTHRTSEPSDPLALR